MAELNVANDENLKTKIEKDGFITVMDPACGSGGLVLAYAKALKKHNINYQSDLLIDVTDISDTCVYMVYIQLSLYGIPAIVKCGNTLTQEIRFTLVTPLYFLQYWKFIKSMIDKPLYDSVVWSNLLVCGKRDGLGTPEVSDELFQLSTEYLYHLYEISKPSQVIILSSPRLVYAKLIRSFLENIGCVMNETISSTQSILVNQEKNIIWTYHPKYLAMSKQTEKVKSICKKYL